MPQKKIVLSVITPVYNEKDNIRILYERLTSELKSLNVGYELVVVDDGSSDGSQKLLEKIAGKDKKVRLVIFRKNFGQTAAIAAGIDYSKGRWIVLIDADLQNDPRDIKRLLAKAKEGYDVVSGWRKNRKDPLFTKVIPSKVANFMIAFLTGVRLHDFGCTLKLYKREFISTEKLYGEMHRFIPAYAFMGGARITEIEVKHYPRVHGKSHYNLSRTLKVFFDIFTVKFLSDYSTKPLYLFGGVGVFTFIMAVIIFSFVVIRVTVFNGGWISPMILLSGVMIILSFQFLLIGLLAEMLTRTYFESTNKTPYIISKKVNF